MTEEKKAQKDYNDPRSHMMLAQYLDSPEKLGIPDFQLKNFSGALEHALSLPEGDVRITLLRVLNTALGDGKRRRELYAENGVLAKQLNDERPDIARLRKTAYSMKAWTRLLRDKFREVYAMDEKSGRDMWKTAWPWYEHELNCYTSAMNREMDDLDRQAEALAALPPDPVVDAGNPPDAESTKDVS